MCIKGCVIPFIPGPNTRSIVPPLTPQNQTMVQLAKPICDIYLKEYIKPTAHIPTNLIQYVEATYQGCITDIMTMGDKKVSMCLTLFLTNNFKKETDMYV